MAEKRVTIHSAEAGVIAELLSERDTVTQKLTVAVRMVCARENIPVALLERLDGNVLVLDVPLDRVESPKTGRGVVGAISAALTPETPLESTLDGKASRLEVPTDGGPVDSMGSDTGNYPNDEPGVSSTLREHGG